MKRILFSGALLLASVAVLSCNKERNKKMTVIRDCSGTYLRFNEKDYRVCNLERVADYEDNANVTVTYKKLEECTGTGADAIVCAMYHPNEGWIQVIKIK